MGTERMTSPPRDCRCIWSTNGSRGAVYISMQADCPAWPHPRTYNTETT